MKSTLSCKTNLPVNYHPTIPTSGCNFTAMVQSSSVFNFLTLTLIFLTLIKLLFLTHGSFTVPVLYIDSEWRTVIMRGSLRGTCTTCCCHYFTADWSLSRRWHTNRQQQFYISITSPLHTILRDQWSRDRWRHVNPMGQGRDPNMFEA